MSISIVAAVPVSDSKLVAWFDNGVSKSYEPSDLNVADAEALRRADVADGGNYLSLGNGSSILAEDLFRTGTTINYVEDEKKRLLESLSVIRREASFSQTKLGEAAGIRQSVISRIEGCEISPQINTLLKLLAPLGKTLAIVDLEEK